MDLHSSAVLRAVSVSVEVAGRAGGVIKKVLQSGELGIVDKGVNDLQTEADRRAQRLILSCLTRTVPRATIVAEEERDDSPLSDEERSLVDEILSIASRPNHMSQKVQDWAAHMHTREEDLVIWVDPLDGTYEYAQGNLDNVTVLIGVAINGRAVGGVMHQPFHGYRSVAEPSLAEGRTIWGLVGVGAYGLTATNERISPPPSLQSTSSSCSEARNLVVATTRIHSTPIVEETLRSLAPVEVVRGGGAGHKVLLVLEGRVDAYVYPRAGSKKWDTAAPEAILRSAGGLLTDVMGTEIPYDASAPHLNERGVIASRTTAIHEHILNTLPNSVQEILSIHKRL